MHKINPKVWVPTEKGKEYIHLSNVINNPIYHHHQDRSTLKLNINLCDKNFYEYIDFMYYNTNDNVTNRFTKTLGKIKFVVGRDNIEIIENSFFHIMLVGKQSRLVIQS
jgi:hypothetical protein